MWMNGILQAWWKMTIQKLLFFEHTRYGYIQAIGTIMSNKIFKNLIEGVEK